MPKHASTAKELRAMTPADLQKEVAQQRNAVAKMRIGVALRSQKDTAEFNRAKRQLARQLTILGQASDTTELKKKAKTPTVPAPNN